MNRLPATILQTEVQDHLMLVHLDAGGNRLKSIVLETPESAPHLVAGEPIQLLFKETEVILGKPNGVGVSLQNRLPCTILSIEKGALLSRILLQYQEYTIASVITSHGVKQLQLKVGDPVLALIKTNELMLGK